jgi:rRNA-processing protein FCF1
MLNINNYIIKKTGQYDYLSVFDYIRDFIHINNYYHLNYKIIAQKINDESKKQLKTMDNIKYYESCVLEYINNNKELFICIGDQEI